MTDVLRHTVIGSSETGYRYRIYDGEKLLLTSGVFLLASDADRCGSHIAADRAVTLDFIKRGPCD